MPVRANGQPAIIEKKTATRIPAMIQKKTTKTIGIAAKESAAPRYKPPSKCPCSCCCFFQEVGGM